MGENALCTSLADPQYIYIYVYHKICYVMNEKSFPVLIVRELGRKQTHQIHTNTKSLLLKNLNRVCYKPLKKSTEIHEQAPMFPDSLDC